MCTLHVAYLTGSVSADSPFLTTFELTMNDAHCGVQIKLTTTLVQATNTARVCHLAAPLHPGDNWLDPNLPRFMQHPPSADDLTNHSVDPGQGYF